MTGLLLIALGVWGAIIPFIGPYFDYGFLPDDSWHWTAARGWLEVLPGAVAIVAGLLLLWSVDRVSASLGAWLGAAAGAWFVVGTAFAPMVDLHQASSPISTGENMVAAEYVGMFYGLGAVIVFLSAVALGRLSVVGVRDVEHAERHRVAREEAARDEAARAAAADRGTREPVAPARDQDAGVGIVTGNEAPPAQGEPMDASVGRHRRLRRHRRTDADREPHTLP
ncbi:MAG TPA: hypothetical protein VHC41_11335 [Mycobacteriales bacterium]|nr:hypothetical protein [Mycobacteriales bacterium]